MIAAHPLGIRRARTVRLKQSPKAEVISLSLSVFYQRQACWEFLN